MALQLLLLLAPLLLRLAGAAHSAGIIRAAADNILESVYSSDTLVGGVAFNNVNYGFGGAAGSFPFTFAAPRHNIAVNAIDVGVPGSVRVSFETCETCPFYYTNASTWRCIQRSSFEAVYGSGSTLWRRQNYDELFDTGVTWLQPVDVSHPAWKDDGHNPSSRWIWLGGTCASQACDLYCRGPIEQNVPRALLRANADDSLDQLYVAGRELHSSAQQAVDAVRPNFQVSIALTSDRPVIAARYTFSTAPSGLRVSTSCAPDCANLATSFTSTSWRCIGKADFDVEVAQGRSSPNWWEQNFDDSRWSNALALASPSGLWTTVTYQAGSSWINSQGCRYDACVTQYCRGLGPSLSSGSKCSGAPNCATLNRFGCPVFTESVANTCGECLPGYTGTAGQSNTLCSPSSCPSNCAALSRNTCTQNGICGTCLAGFVGDAGSANTVCMRMCEHITEAECTARNRAPCQSTAGWTPNTCGACLSGFSSPFAAPSNATCLPGTGLTVATGTVTVNADNILKGLYVGSVPITGEHVNGALIYYTTPVSNAFSFTAPQTVVAAYSQDWGSPGMVRVSFSGCANCATAGSTVTSWRCVQKSVFDAFYGLGSMLWQKQSYNHSTDTNVVWETPIAVSDVAWWSTGHSTASQFIWPSSCGTSCDVYCRGVVTQSCQSGFDAIAGPDPCISSCASATPAFCSALNRGNCVSSFAGTPNTCGNCLSGFNGAAGPSNDACTADCSTATAAYCTQRNREQCSATSTGTPNTCGNCLSGYSGPSGPSNTACTSSCASASDSFCSSLNRVTCSSLASPTHPPNTCGPCQPGFVAVDGSQPGNTQCVADCSAATAGFCADRNRAQCSATASGTPNTCGSCLSGFNGISGSSNEYCTADCSVATQSYCSERNRGQCSATASGTPNTCGDCLTNYLGAAGPSNEVCVSSCAGASDSFCDAANRVRCTEVASPTHPPNTCGVCRSGTVGPSGVANSQCFACECVNGGTCFFDGNGAACDCSTSDRYDGDKCQYTAHLGLVTFNHELMSIPISRNAVTYTLTVSSAFEYPAPSFQHMDNPLGPQSSISVETVLPATLCAAEGETISPAGTQCVGVVPFNQLTEVTRVTVRSGGGTMTNVYSFFVLRESCTFPPAQLLTTDLPLSLDASLASFSANTLRVGYRESMRYAVANLNQRAFGDTERSDCQGHWSWSVVRYIGGSECARAWQGSAPWESVYKSGANPTTGCGIRRDDDPERFTFSADFSVTTEESLPPIRSEARTRRLEHALPFQVIFNRTAAFVSNFSDTENGGIVVSAPVVVVAAIARQEVIGQPPALVGAAVDLITTVQWPFKLTQPVFSMIAGVAPPAQGGVLAAGAIAPAVGSPISATCNDVNGQLCGIVWRLPLTSTAQTCNFNGEYRVSFTVACHNSVVAANNCPLTAVESTAELSFTLASSSHCAEVVATVGLVPSLLTFDRNLVPQDDFLVDDTVTARLSVKSPTATLRSASLVAAELALLDAANEVVTSHVLRTAGVNSATGNAMVLTQTVAGGAAAPGVNSVVQFTLALSSAYLSLPPDGSRRLRLVATVAVVYESTGQSALLEWRSDGEGAGTLNVAERATARRVMSARVPRSDSPPAEASGGSGGVLGGLSVTAAAAVGGVALVVAALVIAVVVALRRRRGAQSALGEEAKTLHAAPMRSSSSQLALVQGEPAGEGEEEGAAATPTGGEATVAAVELATLDEVRLKYDAMERARGATSD